MKNKQIIRNKISVEDYGVELLTKKEKLFIDKEIEDILDNDKSVWDIFGTPNYGSFQDVLAEIIFKTINTFHNEWLDTNVVQKDEYYYLHINNILDNIDKGNKWQSDMRDYIQNRFVDIANSNNKEILFVWAEQAVVFPYNCKYTIDEFTKKLLEQNQIDVNIIKTIEYNYNIYDIDNEIFDELERFLVM